MLYEVITNPSSVGALTQDAYRRYGVHLDTGAALAYGAVAAAGNRVFSDEGTVVLMTKDHPAFESERIYRETGSRPDLPPGFEAISGKVEELTRIDADQGSLKAIVEAVTKE